MPITPAHAIFAPLVDRWTAGRLPLSALAIGCMMPDAEYFLYLRPVATWGHTPLGLLAWDLPVGLVALVVLQALLRPQLPLLLPDAARARLATLAAWRWGPGSRFVSICAAIVLGAATHLALDSFTHPDGWPVRRLAPLREEVAGLPVFKWLQYGLGVLFVALLAAWTARWYRATQAAPDLAPGLSRRRRLLGLAGLPAVVAPFAIWNGLRLATGDPHPGSTFLAGAAFAAHAGCVVYAIGVALVLRVSHRTAR